MARNFVVEVTFDPESSMWVGVCSDIGLVTEAETFEALEHRAMLIAQELAIDNGAMTADDTARFFFQHEYALA